MRHLVTAATLLLALPAAAQPVDGLWAVVHDGSSAVKLGLIGRHEGDDDLRLFRISCDKWGAVDLVFFGEAGLAEKQDYELSLTLDGRAWRFAGEAERSELGALTFWAATVPLDHPLLDRLTGAHSIHLAINGHRFTLPSGQLHWAAREFRGWCSDLAPQAARAPGE